MDPDKNILVECERCAIELLRIVFARWYATLYKELPNKSEVDFNATKLNVVFNNLKQYYSNKFQIEKTTFFSRKDKSALDEKNWKAVEKDFNRVTEVAKALKYLFDPEQSLSRAADPQLALAFQQRLDTYVVCAQRFAALRQLVIEQQTLSDTLRIEAGKKTSPIAGSADAIVICRTELDVLLKRCQQPVYDVAIPVSVFHVFSTPLEIDPVIKTLKSLGVTLRFFKQQDPRETIQRINKLVTPYLTSPKSPLTLFYVELITFIALQMNLAILYEQAISCLLAMLLNSELKADDTDALILREIACTFFPDNIAALAALFDPATPTRDDRELRLEALMSKVTFPSIPKETDRQKRKSKSFLRDYLKFANFQYLLRIISNVGKTIAQDPEAPMITEAAAATTRSPRTLGTEKTFQQIRAKMQALFTKLLVFDVADVDQIEWETLRQPISAHLAIEETVLKTIRIIADEERWSTYWQGFIQQEFFRQKKGTHYPTTKLSQPALIQELEQLIPLPIRRSFKQITDSVQWPRHIGNITTDSAAAPTLSTPIPDESEPLFALTTIIQRFYNYLIDLLDNDIANKIPRVRNTILAIHQTFSDKKLWRSLVTPKLAGLAYFDKLIRLLLLYLQALKLFTELLIKSPEALSFFWPQLKEIFYNVGPLPNTIADIEDLSELLDRILRSHLNALQEMVFFLKEGNFLDSFFSEKSPTEVFARDMVAGASKAFEEQVNIVFAQFLQLRRKPSAHTQFLTYLNNLKLPLIKHPVYSWMMSELIVKLKSILTLIPSDDASASNTLDLLPQVSSLFALQIFLLSYCDIFTSNSEPRKWVEQALTITFAENLYHNLANNEKVKIVRLSELSELRIQLFNILFPNTQTLQYSRLHLLATLPIDLSTYQNSHLLIGDISENFTSSIETKDLFSLYSENPFKLFSVTQSKQCDEIEIKNWRKFSANMNGVLNFMLLHKTTRLLLPLQYVDQALTKDFPFDLPLSCRVFSLSNPIDILRQITRLEAIAKNRLSGSTDTLELSDDLHLPTFSSPTNSQRDSGHTYSCPALRPISSNPGSSRSSMLDEDDMPPVDRDQPLSPPQATSTPSVPMRDKSKPVNLNPEKPNFATMAHFFTQIRPSSDPSKPNGRGSPGATSLPARFLGSDQRGRTGTTASATTEEEHLKKFEKK